MAKNKNKPKKDAAKTSIPPKTPKNHPLSTAKDGQKYCPKCKTVQPVANFPTDNRRNDHLYIYCRGCEAKRQYEKYTRLKIKKAEEEGIVAIKITHPAPSKKADPKKE